MNYAPMLAHNTVKKSLVIYTFANLTPVLNPNPYYGAGKMPAHPIAAVQKYYQPQTIWIRNNPAEQWLMDHGCNSIGWVSDETINRTPWWNGKKPGDQIYGPTDNIVDPTTFATWSNPPASITDAVAQTHEAFRANVALANGNANYWDDPAAKTTPYRALMFDIEGSPGWFQQPDIDKRFGAIQAMLDVARNAAGNMPLCWYYTPPEYTGGNTIAAKTAAMVEAEKYASLVGPWLSFYLVCNYNNDPTFFSPSQWYELSRQQDYLIERFSPGAWKVATVCPSYQLWWTAGASDAAKAMAGKPVPNATWKQQLQTLTDLGYDLCMYTSGGTFEECGMQNLQTFLSFANK